MTGGRACTYSPAALTTTVVHHFQRTAPNCTVSRSKRSPAGSSVVG